MPPFPNRRFIGRSALAAVPSLAECELLTIASQAQAPLRVEPHEWSAIADLLYEFDLTNRDYRSAWPE